MEMVSTVQASPYCEGEVADFKWSIAQATAQPIYNDAGSLAMAQENFLAARGPMKELKHKKITQLESVHPFGNDFSIQPREVEIIRDIICYMDSKSTIALGLPTNQKHLKDEGKKIDHVHPLCFIWAIIHQEDLRAKLKDFRDNSAFALKWNGFLGYSAFHDKGFGRNMERYYNHRNPQEFLWEFDAFYGALHLKPEVMTPFVLAKDWRGFAEALVNESSYR